MMYNVESLAATVASSLVAGNLGELITSVIERNKAQTKLLNVQALEVKQRLNDAQNKTSGLL